MAQDINSLDLKKLVKESIDKRLQEVADEEFAKAKERIDERKSDVIASVVLDVSRFVDYQTVGSELRISVKKIDTPITN